MGLAARCPGCGRATVEAVAEAAGRLRVDARHETGVVVFLVFVTAAEDDARRVTIGEEIEFTARLDAHRPGTLCLREAVLA
jgi:hypothetical protein